MTGGSANFEGAIAAKYEVRKVVGKEADKLDSDADTEVARSGATFCSGSEAAASAAAFNGVF